MTYLTGYSKNTLEEISINSYVLCTESLGGSCDASNTTKYLYQIIQHPVTSDYALIISDDYLLYLPESYLEELVSKEVMESNGWFNYDEN